MKRLILFLMMVLFLVAGSALAADPPKETSYSLKLKIKKLNQASAGLNKLHRQLQINLNEVVRLHQRAESNIHGNALKVFLKGSLEIYQKVTAPLNSAYDLVAETLGTMYLEPIFYQINQDRVVLMNLSRDGAKRSRKLRVLYQSLGQVMAAPMSRFDNDFPPFPYTSRSWKKADGDKDDKIELATRKLRVIYDLTGLIEEKTRQEMASVRTDRKKLLNQRAAMNQRLAKVQALEDIRTREMKRHNEMIARRMKAAAKKSKGGLNSRGEQTDQRPEVPLTPAEKAFKDKIRQEQRAASLRKRQLKEKARQERARLIKQTEVYVLSECSRHVVAGELSTFVAAIDPPVLKGYFRWELDDKYIGQGRVLKYTFPKEDIHDLSVTFFSQRKYVDRYLDQVRVLAAAKPSEPPLYPAALEGKKTPALNIACCKYWIYHKDNRVYLTGHYRTLAGRQVKYTSLALKHYVPRAPNAGLFALKNGTGYHVYSTYGQGKGTHYVICRMKGEEVKIIHRLRVDYFNMNFSPDFTKAYVIYKNHGSKVKRKIVLR